MKNSDTSLSGMKLGKAKQVYLLVKLALYVTAPLNYPMSFFSRAILAGGKYVSSFSAREIYQQPLLSYTPVLLQLENIHVHDFC